MIGLLYFFTDRLYFFTDLLYFFTDLPYTVVTELLYNVDTSLLVGRDIVLWCSPPRNCRAERRPRNLLLDSPNHRGGWGVVSCC